jgi:DNA adenine methylase
VKGRFVLSVNDRPEVCALFAGFEIEAVSVSYTVGHLQRGHKAGELLISNGPGAS